MDLFGIDKCLQEKDRIFEKFMKSKNLTKEELNFCEINDWHPVDELPLKEEFIEEMKKIRKGKFHKYCSIEELRKDIEED